MNTPSQPVTSQNLDVAADKQGKTVDVEPASNKRLLELQAELEKTEGPRRVEIQKEIERIGRSRGPVEGSSVRREA